MTFTKDRYPEARREAQRIANHWQQPAAIRKQGGQHGYPLEYAVGLAARNDSDFERCEIMQPEEGEKR